MERPIADRIGGKIPRHLAAWLDDDGVFARRVITVPRHQLEEVPVDMWIGCPIMLSLMRLIRTRSPSRKGIGSIMSDIFTPSNDHMKRSMLPVR